MLVYLDARFNSYKEYNFCLRVFEGWVEMESIEVACIETGVVFLAGREEGEDG